MRNVVLARVDDRLIHGEVVSVWTPTLSVNTILVVDDEVAKDDFNKRVIRSLAPEGVKVFVSSVEGAVKGLLKDPIPGERVMVLTKSPISFARIVDAGVPLKEVNLGGMGLRGERKTFIKNVAASPAEVESIREMRAKGVHVFYQLVPEQAVIEVDDALEKAGKE